MTNKNFRNILFGTLALLVAGSLVACIPIKPDLPTEESTTLAKETESSKPTKEEATTAEKTTEDAGAETTSDKAEETTEETAAGKITLSYPKSLEVFQGHVPFDLYCSATSADDAELSYLWYETTTGKLEDIIAVNRGEEMEATLPLDSDTVFSTYYVCKVTSADGEEVYTEPILVSSIPFAEYDKTIEMAKGYDNALEFDYTETFYTAMSNGVCDEPGVTWYQTSTGKLQDIMAVNRGEMTGKVCPVDTSVAGTYYYVIGFDRGNEYSSHMVYSDIITVIVK